MDFRDGRNVGIEESLFNDAKDRAWRRHRSGLRSAGAVVTLPANGFERGRDLARR